MDKNNFLSRLRALGLNALALLISLTIVLLLMEGVVRLAGLESASYHSISGFCKYDAELGWNLVPDRTRVFKGEHFSAVVEISEQGLRDRLYPLKPEPGRRRILVIGDSVAWCWGVDIDECFTKKMERELNDTDVITMGVPGFSTAQELLMYERDGRQFQSDIVLLAFVGNDPADNLNEHNRPRFRIVDDELVIKNQPVPRRKSVVKEWAEKNSRLYVQAKLGAKIAGLLIRSWRDEEPLGKNKYVQPERSSQIEAVSLSEALIERFHYSVTEDGARLVIAMIDTAEIYKSSLRNLCSRLGCQTLDLDPSLARAAAQGIEIRLKGDPHYSPAGQAVMTKKIIESQVLN